MDVESSEHSELESTESHDVKNNMLDRVAKSNAHFKHQQRGEPDLTFEQKRMIADELLQRNPGIFLSRFNSYLALDDLAYFEGMQDDYTVNFFLKEVQSRFADSKNQRVKNRRYEAMKQLVNGGTYFSDQEMKSRDPLLYEQMVGQYLTKEEILAEVQQHTATISSVLLDQIQAIYNNELYARQVEQEESQLEEGDSDEEEEEQMEDAKDGGENKQISEAERQMLRNEFLAIMKERFLHGEDVDFDYQSVDNSAEYDALDIRDQDEEEKYFDADDSEDDHSPDPDHQNVNRKMQEMEL